jgi:hypothetical protein
VPLEASFPFHPTTPIAVLHLLHLLLSFGSGVTPNRRDPLLRREALSKPFEVSFNSTTQGRCVMCPFCVVCVCGCACMCASPTPLALERTYGAVARN